MVPNVAESGWLGTGIPKGDTSSWERGHPYVTVVVEMEGKRSALCLKRWGRRDERAAGLFSLVAAGGRRRRRFCARGRSVLTAERETACQRISRCVVTGITRSVAETTTCWGVKGGGETRPLTKKCLRLGGRRNPREGTSGWLKHLKKAREGQATPLQLARKSEAGKGLIFIK